MIIDTENIQELLKSDYPSTQIGVETGLSISGINNYRTGKSKFENITLKYLQGLQGFYDNHHGKTNQEKLNITGIRKAVSAFNAWQGAARVYFDPSDTSVWTKTYASPREWDKYKDPKITQIAQKATNRMDERNNTITMREIRELIDGVEKND